MKRIFGPLMSGVLSLLAGLTPLQGLAQQPTVAIAIHGGAGTLTREAITPEQDRAYREILARLVDEGHQQLLEGTAGLDVVVSIIQALEASPLFNAGVGAVLTWEGQHELDAAIMEGGSLRAGAVAGVKTVRSPIAAARAVMQASPHVMLAGAGAETFAREQGLEMVNNSVFTTKRRAEALERYKAQRNAGINTAADTKFGTVGVVVLDAVGNLVAGTSTGGMTGKRWGRIGDSPVIGAGTYANNASCAVSATGHGEYFIRHQVASDICARMQYLGLSLNAAANQVVLGDLVEVGGEGGVIAVDLKGNVAMPFNTEGMYRASIDGQGNKIVAIYGAED